MEPLTVFEGPVDVGVDGRDLGSVADVRVRPDPPRRPVVGDEAASGDNARDRRPGSLLGDETDDSDSLDESVDIGVSRDAMSIDKYSLISPLNDD